MAYEKQPPLGQTTMASSLPVAIASDQSAVPISAASLPLPSTAATSTKQSDGTQKTQIVDSGGTNLGTTTNPVAIQPPASGTLAVDVAKMNGVATTMGNGVAGTGVQRVAIASDNTPFPIKIDQTTPGTTNGIQINAALPAGTNAIGKLAANSGVDIGDVDITSVVPGTGATNLGKAEDAAHSSGDTGVFSLGVANEAQSSFGADGDYTPQATDVKGNTMNVGNIAHDGVDAGNPVKIGGKASSAEPAAVANADRVNAFFDLVGRQIVAMSNPENMVSGVITSAMTGTTSTSLIAAPASGLRNYITQITVSNTHATVGTNIEIQDGSGGTTIYIIPAAAVYGGAVITFPVPLRQPTTATALYCKNSTTGSSTFVSASGYKGA